MKYNDRLDIRTDSEVKRKAMFMLKCKGSNLTTEVNKMCEKLAEEYDKENKGGK